MKMKEFGPKGRPWRPLGSATGNFVLLKFENKQDTFIRHLNFYSKHNDKSKFAFTLVNNFQFILRQQKISFRDIKLPLYCLILV